MASGSAGRPHRIRQADVDSLSTKRVRSFRCQPLEELSRQLLFSPPDKRAQQLRRAETLHDELDAQRSYPLEFLIFRVTSRRVKRESQPLLVGDAVLHDLRLLIDALSQTVSLPADAADPNRTIAQVASSLNVATRTVQRWRQTGLRWRRVPAAKKRTPTVVIPDSALRCFERRGGLTPGKPAGLSRLTASERATLLARARRLAQRTGASLHRVARHLARKTQRPVQTVRYVLIQHDRERPKEMIFTNHAGPLSVRDKQVIYRAHRVGVAVPKIARRFRRTRATIYRALRDRRAEAVLRADVRHVTLPLFSRPDADAVLLRTLPGESANRNTLVHDPGDLPAALATLFRQPEPPEPVRRHALVRANYLCFKAAQARDALDPHEPRARDLECIERWLQQAALSRGQAVRWSLPSALSVCRRHLLGVHDPGQQALMRLLEESVSELTAATREFDFTRNQTFESHVAWRLMQRFARDATPSSAMPRLRATRRVEPAEVAERLRRLARDAGFDLSPT